MSIVFDSVLSAALARELDALWSGRRLVAVRFHGEQRRVRLGFAGDAWVWLLHPLEGVLAAVPRRPGGDDPTAGRGRSRGPRASGLLEGARRVVAVESPPDTRSILVQLEGPETGDEQLVFDLVTNRWNALHVVAGRVRSVLMPDLGRDPLRPGDAWEAPVSRRRWAESAPTAEQWEAGLRNLVEEGEGPARRRLAWLSSMNEAFVLPGGPADALAGEPAIRDSLARYGELRDAALHDPPAGWLLPRGDGGANDEATPRLYPAALDTPGAEHAGSVLEGMAALAERAPRVAEGLRAATEDPETTRLRAALEDRKERSARKIHALEAQVDTGRDPDELRQLGHLLLARKAAVPSGAEQARLEGFGGDPVVVTLDPTLDAIGNAEALYDEAKRLERAAEQLPRRIDRERRRLAALDAGLERLDADGPDDELWKLAGGRPTERDTSKSAGRRGGAAGDPLPYRVYRTSSGLEVRAGRSARANDDLTFHHSAPDDIWMHVRETPGSHVVLRWGRKDQNPPEADLAEAALVAAVLSRARGSGIVPVAWTRRKYVRKPRKAAPGAVLPERTQTVFVEPDAERVKKMAEEDPDA